MADAGYRVQGSSLEKGDAQALNEATDLANSMPMGSGINFGMAFGDAPQETDVALYGPTHRPSTPITQGAPFGPGADFVPRPFEDERDYTHRVARRVIEAGRAMPDDALSWALRTLVS